MAEIRFGATENAIYRASNPRGVPAGHPEPKGSVEIDWYDEDLSWKFKGACNGKDPGLWFPERSSAKAQKAKEICMSECPVRQECLDYALKHGEDHGIWGGIGIGRYRNENDVTRRCIDCDCHLQPRSKVAWCIECDPNPTRKAQRRYKAKLEQLRREKVAA